MSVAFQIRKAVRKLFLMKELPTLEQYPAIHRQARRTIRRLDLGQKRLERLNAELFKLEQSLPEPQDAEGEDGSDPEGKQS